MKLKNDYTFLKKISIIDISISIYYMILVLLVLL